jgi:ubiquinone/menaquinone biosynthesis C-methylase UbiE
MLNQVNQQFFNRFYRKGISWIRTSLDHQVVMAKKLLLSSLRSVGMPVSGIRVLDIGFGTGVQLFAFGPSCSIYGTEISDEAVRHAEAIAQRRGYRQYCFRRSEPDGRTPFDDASFDLVVASHIIEHLEDDEGMLREIARVLHPNGVGAILIPLESNLEGVISRDDQIKKEWLSGDSFHVRAYNFETFEQLIVESNLEVLFARRWDRMKDVRRRHKERPNWRTKLAALIVRVLGIALPFSLLDVLDGWLARRGWRARQGIWLVRRLEA